MVGMVATLVVAPDASAEQPAKLLKLRDTDRGVSRAVQFELPSIDRASHGGELTSPSHHAALIGEVVGRPTPSWPSASQLGEDVTPPILVMQSQRADDARDDLAWGLAGTGASIFTGALLFHIESLALQEEYQQLTPGAHSGRYRELGKQLDQTRKFVLTLYAVGGSMITSGVVLMANDERDGPTAKLAPAWMNGGPAARLKISF
jgi:hypothetical protein